MKVCRLVWEFPKAHEITYGLGPNFYHISREQVKLGLDVHVIARRNPNEPSYEEMEGIKVHRVKAPYNVNAIWKLRELNKKLGIDIVHSHGTCGILYPLFRKILGIPLVVHVHGTTLAMKEHAYRLPIELSLKYFLKSRFREEASILRQKLFWRHADLLIVVSESQKEELEALYGLDSKKIRVVYNGADTSIFKPLRDVQYKEKLQLENKRVILYVGHFGFRKGITYLLEAMPQVLREIPNAFLLCVGGTPEWMGTHLHWRFLEDIIERIGIRDHVKLVGQIPHHELPYYYSLSDVFVIPTLYEAFGKVIIEAMACETPVIASRVGGTPEIIKDDINGVLVEPKNVEQLADAIVRILRDKNLARSMGRSGRLTVEAKFTWNCTAKELLSVYQELLIRKGLNSKMV